MAQRLPSPVGGLSVREAAQVSGVSYETVARWIRNEELPAVKVRVRGRSREWRIKRTDLRRFLQG